MKNHHHEALRGHIERDAFKPETRNAWRESHRYQEALKAHHANCNDRPALLETITTLIQKMETMFSYFSQDRNTRILDIGCGTGEVSSMVLGRLGLFTSLDYIGIDKSEDVLKSAKKRIEESVSPNAFISLLQKDYGARDWADSGPLREKPFQMIWLFHSGYYLDDGHRPFMEKLEGLTDARGMMIFMHNPEGNDPYRAAAKELGMKAYGIEYRREIKLPCLQPAVFDALREDPGDLDAFTRRFAEYPEARSLRLLLEFYLPDYPLEALSHYDRSLYVTNWQRHIRAENGRFSNVHEMLLVLPRHHAADVREGMDSSFERMFQHEG